MSLPPSPEKSVNAVAALDDVVAAAAGDRVIARAAQKGIVPTSAGDRVIAQAALEAIAVAVPGECVVCRAANCIRNCGERGDSGCDTGREINRHRQRCAAE